MRGIQVECVSGRNISKGIALELSGLLLCACLCVHVIPRLNLDNLVKAVIHWHQRMQLPGMAIIIVMRHVRWSHFVIILTFSP